MTFIQLIFYIFSAIAVGSAVMVVASSNPVRGALCLVLVFFAMAGIWLLLHAEFLALILVLVYVGAVMTLFLFVVMMLRLNVINFRESFVRYLPFGILIILLMLGLTILALGPEHIGFSALPKEIEPPADSNTANLGMVLYTFYAYPFEIAAVLLLTAIVAAISLAYRHPRRRLGQDSQVQVSVKRNHRVRLIKMPSVRKIKPSESGEV